MTDDRTWLCTFEVSVDLPATMSNREMECLIAQCMATQLNGLGYAGNVAVTLIATAGNITVLNAAGNYKRMNDPEIVGKLPPAPPVEIPADPGPPAALPTVAPSVAQEKFIDSTRLPEKP